MGDAEKQDLVGILEPTNRRGPEEKGTLMPPIEDSAMTADRDLLIEIKTMLQVALTRITGHDARLEDHEQRIRCVETRSQVMEATAASSRDVSVLQATDVRDREDTRHRTAVTWQMVAAMAGVAAVVATIATALAQALK